MKHVYLDHNVVDDVGKGVVVLEPTPAFQWVYSDEHFREISRAGDTRFLNTLRDLRARKLQLKHDDSFRILEEAEFLGEEDPHRLYEAWLRANAEVPTGDHFSPIVSRLFGADNFEDLTRLPERF